MMRSIRVSHGASGFGGPLILTPTRERNVVLSVTGGGIHPIAQQIAEMTGAQVVNGFQTSVPDEQVMAVVIDCGGTARAGVYPKKGFYTVNVLSVGAVGPLARFITADLYVSGVGMQQLEYVEDTKAGVATVRAWEPVQGRENEAAQQRTQAHQQEEAAERASVQETPAFQPEAEHAADRQEPVDKTEGLRNTRGADQRLHYGFQYALLQRIGRGVSRIIDPFYQAARDAIEIVIKSILPFMAFVSLIVGIITSTKIGNALAEAVIPFVSTPLGLVLMATFCALPVLSPLLGPGAIVAQVVGVLIGAEIGRGNLPPQMALPALFAINAQVGADFIPVALSLAEAEKETIEVGIPAILISRLITGPIAVILAYAASAGLYQS